MARVRSFSGPALARVAFPLGGIGTGTVSLSGRGALTDFEWWNHPGKGYVLPYTFFALALAPRRGRSQARVLAGPPAPPFDQQGFGLPREQGQGLPHFRRAVFRGEYPFANVRLTDPDFPVAVEIEAWNPMLPMDADDSGLPLAVLRYRLRNRTPRRLTATVIGTLFNAVGLDGTEVPFRRRHGALGGNRNRRTGGPRGLVGLEMNRDGAPTEKHRDGSLFLGVLGAEQPTFQNRWPAGAWFDDLQLFWDRLCATGTLDDDDDEGASPAGSSDPGSVAETVVLPARSSRDVVFLLSWYFPDFTNRWNADEARVAGKPLRAHYGTRFKDALDVARYAADEMARLHAATRRFHDAFFSQTLPTEVLDAASSQVSTLRTPTCLWLDSGRFHAFEGCFNRAGCCPMDCTHVWNYAQALPHLWPTLERTLRATAFENNLFEDGRQAFRSLIPLEEGVRFDRKPSTDGQLGEVLKLHRDWRVSGDTAWLEGLWPAAKRALEFAFVQWDAGEKGVVDGEQHVTYDIELYGPNPYTQVLYVGALRAASAMAEAVGDGASARRYASLAQKGLGHLDTLCWNGAYYVQRVPEADAIRTDPQASGSLGGSLEGLPAGAPPKYQIGDGCLSDQLFGEWLARASGLGPVLPRGRVRRALASVFRHNFRRSLRDHPNAQRIYALGDEPGLLLCSWPRGGRPALPFPYADEVWTGIEYHVAAHLVWEGLVEEGLEMVRATRSRFDGVKRNPWDEIECGHHYARAMSSWSLLHALSGFGWDGVEERLTFAPKVEPTRFRGLFTAGTGWGSFEQRRTGRRLDVKLRVLGGHLKLRVLDLRWPAGAPPRRVELTEAPAGSRLRRTRARLEILLPDGLHIATGGELAFRLVAKS
jgi:uncharacterized protein (DUF608 family)